MYDIKRVNQYSQTPNTVFQSINIIIGENERNAHPPIYSHMTVRFFTNVDKFSRIFKISVDSRK